MLSYKLKRQMFSYSIKALMYLCAFITVSLSLFLISYIVYNAYPYITYEILTTKPSYLKGTIGILPDILNTIYIIFTTILIVLPLGVGAAIYLVEYAKNKRLVTLIEYAIETLSGIPSIIYGLFGMLFFINFMNLQTSLLAGSLTLVIMSLPTIIRTTSESLKTVSKSYREGAFALGARQFYVIRTVVLPSCISGISASLILAIGRMLGESAALLFTAGFAHGLNNYFDGMYESGATLSVALFVYAKEQGEFEVAFVIAFILLILSFIINMLTTFLSKRFQK